MIPDLMFHVHLHKVSNLCFSAKMQDLTWTWHFRYGHLNLGGLKTLQWNRMVIGLLEIVPPFGVCEDCVVSKHHRESFSSGKSVRAKKLLEVVHSDICGSLNPTSNGGKHYFITFTNDLTQKT